jgi:hypothetical protein
MEFMLKNFHISNINLIIFRDWYHFNVLQRIHLNYVENISIATTSTLAAGLYNPRYAAYAGLTYIVGR